MLISFPNGYVADILPTTEKTHVGLRLYFPDGSPILFLTDEEITVLTTVEGIGLLNWVLSISTEANPKRVQVALHEWLIDRKTKNRK